jgi:hypothetical protein
MELIFKNATPTPDLVDVLDEIESLIEDVGSGWMAPALAVPEGLYVFVDLPPEIEEELREPIVSVLTDALGATVADGSGLPVLEADALLPGWFAEHGRDVEAVRSRYVDLRIISDQTGFEEPIDVADELMDFWDRNPDKQLQFLTDCLALEGSAVYAEITEAAFADRPGVLGFCRQWARTRLALL